ncbi:hypothetical protein BFJ63_vAg16071 [Fusarium oxysporum f. sp. narcissi]|uniref:DUF7908 domain-containing protein n=1 Tax=Fusarium oxysporum f. sp. narcissi TaxID=451672 RepID=A0A4Q2V289_FUSOX|nr:hypothetical protein BFJ63_vAg16071 [Fusarium oxysporum f. sp. narcissi]
MKSYILATSLLGSVGIASAAEYPSMIMDTWCITYLSTYLAPISGQPASSPSRHLTFFGNSSAATASYTNDQSIIASETVTTPTLDSDLSTLSVARTDSEAPSSGPMTGSLTEPIVTPSLSATDITSSTLPTSTGVVEPPGRSVIFLVQAPSNQKRDIKKREIGGFVGADNPDVCTFALTFNLAEGQLFVNGLPTSYVGEDYKALGVQDEDSFVQGSITKTFGTTGRTLFFRNSGLPNGEAGFCQDSSGQVYITFSASPPGCVPVTLGVYDVTQCQNGQLVGFETSTSALPVTSEETTLEPTTSEATTPEVTTPEVTTPEAVSSGGVSSGKPTTAETTVSTEFNSLSSAEPSSTFSEPSGSEAFTTVSSQIVPTASSQIINTSTLTSSQIFGSVSSTVSSEPGTGVFSTVSSQTISSSASAISSEAPITVSSQIVDTSASTLTQTFGVVTSTIASSEPVESSVTTQSSIFSSDLSTEASSSTEQEVTSLLTVTSDGPTDTTSETFGSTSETSSESASPSTLSSTEETTINESTTSSESTTEITSTTTEASTADTTTDLTSTTTTAAPPSECENTSNPYTVSGVDFTISCNSVVTGGTSVGTAPSNSFNQCVSFCVAFSACVAIQYERATGSCTGFSAMGGTAANSAFDVAARV